MIFLFDSLVLLAVAPKVPKRLAASITTHEAAPDPYLPCIHKYGLNDDLGEYPSDSGLKPPPTPPWAARKIHTRRGAWASMVAKSHQANDQLPSLGTEQQTCRDKEGRGEVDTAYLCIHGRDPYEAARPTHLGLP